MWGCLGILIVLAILDGIFNWIGANRGMLTGVTGLVLLGLAAGAWATHRQKKAELFDITTGSPISVKELHDAAKYTADRLGESGYFGQPVELSGVIRSKSPLLSELAKRPCVYYSMSVTREYEETVYVTNEKGRRERSTRRQSEHVASNSRLIDSFVLEGDSGMIVVNPEGAQLETIKVLDDFDYNGQQRMPRGAMTHTIGYHRQEEALPVGETIYVRGYATDAGGTLVVQKPVDKDGKFVFSLSTRTEVLEKLRSDIATKKATAVGLGVLGVVLLLAAPFWA